MQRYKVTFTYVEPTYAQARGIAERAYRAPFEVLAIDPTAAIERAMALFEAAQRESGVSWARVIQTTTCEVVARSVG